VRILEALLPLLVILGGVAYLVLGYASAATFVAAAEKRGWPERLQAALGWAALAVWPVMWAILLAASILRWVCQGMERFLNLAGEAGEKLGKRL